MNAFPMLWECCRNQQGVWDLTNTTERILWLTSQGVISRQDEKYVQREVIPENQADLPPVGSYLPL